MEPLISIEDSHVDLLHEIGIGLATADGFGEVLARAVEFASGLGSGARRAGGYFRKASPRFALSVVSGVQSLQWPFGSKKGICSGP